MAESRTAKLKKFAATLPPEDSELVICPPDCKIWHDAGKIGAPKPPEVTEAKSTRQLQIWEIMEDTRAKPLPITRKRLEHHARMFGPEEVQNVADAMGIEVDLTGFKSPADAFKKVRKAKQPPKIDRARKMFNRGIPWDAIADSLNLSRVGSDEMRDTLLAEREVAAA